MGVFIIKILNRIRSFEIKFLYKLLFLNKIHFSKKVIIYPGTHIIIENGGTLIIGSNCFFNKNCSINCHEKINIGNNCIFGENVLIYDHNHKFSDNNQIIKKQGYNTKEINIKDNCWICSNVVILPGVTIGENCVIGAGCVINKNIPKNSIVHLEKGSYIVKERV